MSTSFRPSRSFSPVALALLALLVPALAHAHPGHPGHDGLAAGLAHPVSGLDHLCAMIAVGLLAAQRGGRALWLLPLSFLSVMALGGVLGASGLVLPMTEVGIVCSVLVLGVMIAAALEMPVAASMAIVGIFAAFHGFAHGAEMPQNGSGLIYGAGFVLVTAALHAAGIGLGLATNRKTVRWAGGAVALCGVILALA